MKYRKPVKNKFRSARKFSKGITRTKKINTRPAPMRGGTRLS